ncbi:hypothetical protein AVEN_98112-1 [Araneus ventricosus]|uniref:Uncharacterized protein n=1 Tax=Araneus ventricosus TaxID=182803 RepID=A0A4Y2HFN0_ARAVE|nr:hypothetical protein AVEN_98112-1 [Araneus ventricosus]
MVTSRLALTCCKLVSHLRTCRDNFAESLQTCIASLLQICCKLKLLSGFCHLISAAILWFILFYFGMENTDGIPTWNMLKKEDLQNVLGLHSCSVITTGLRFIMHLAFYTTVKNSFNSIELMPTLRPKAPD